MIPPVPRRIGIDLDNTIVNYDAVAQFFADQESLPNVMCLDDLRKRFKVKHAEKWQLLQSKIYTEGLTLAQPTENALAFLSKARNSNVELYLVSHKTSFTPARFGGKDLRTPALEWLKRESVYPNLISGNNVYFCESQQEKIQTIVNLQLDWFVDDLREVLEHPKFPSQTFRWWFAPNDEPKRIPDDRDFIPSHCGGSFCNFEELMTYL